MYVPSGYQIGGVTMIVPRDHVRSTEMGLEDARRFVITAGVRSTAAAVAETSAPAELPAAGRLNADQSVERCPLQPQAAGGLQAFGRKR